MRARGILTAIGLALAALALPLSTTAVTSAQAARSPDPAQIAISQSDASGWNQTLAERDEIWATSDSAAPSSPSQVYAFQTVLSRPLADGTQEMLVTRVSEGLPDLAVARFQALQHDALGQTPIALPLDPSVGWWEGVGTTRNGDAAARLGNLVVELHVTGVSSAAPVGDADVAGWLSTMAARAAAAPDIGPLDWSQVRPDQPLPWQFVLDTPSMGDDWDPQTGLQLSTQELGGTVQSMSATRTYSRAGAYRRMLSSSATAYPSPDAATTLGMSGPGDEISAPGLGDQTTAFKATIAGGVRDAPQVTYTVNIRRGTLVLTTQETGVAYSLDAPDETVGFATMADARAAELLRP